MPPKQRITREMILERSFAMFCREGMEAVNARSVAKALNCSTQPIFSYFEGMDDLRQTIDQKAKDTFTEVMRSGIGEGGLFGCCAAYVRLASEQPRLFTRLLMQAEGQGADALAVEGLEEQLKSQLGEQVGLDGEKADTLYRELWVYVHGLAMLSAAGRLAYDGQAISGRIAFAFDALLARIRG